MGAERPIFKAHAEREVLGLASPKSLNQTPAVSPVVFLERRIQGITRPQCIQVQSYPGDPAGLPQGVWCAFGHVVSSI